MRLRLTLHSAVLLAVLLGCRARTSTAPNPAGVTARQLDTARNDAATAPIKAAIEATVIERAARTPGAIVRVVAYSLDGSGPRINILGDSLVHAASTMKVPVLIELARRADRGAVQLDGTMPLQNSFASIVDGSIYTLSQADDSDDSVYMRVGRRVPIRWLATRMITHSSNLATNALLTVVAADSVTATTRRLGTTRMLVRRGVEDGPAFRAGLNNTTTASDLAALLLAIATDRAASKASCAWMRDVLFAQAYNSAIPVGLPPGTRIAHKTGDITRVEHDAAIVYPENGRPYVLVVLTSGIEKQSDARTLIADVARIVHPALR
jgi:beta-lactamase class A